MKYISKEELSNVLIDVRKSYRLLYFYQRRILDTIKYISDLLSINPVGGYSIFSNNTPRDDSRPQFDKWAWDWLNLYMYEFYYGHRDIDRDRYYFAIQVQSDTGCYDTNVIETDVISFSEPEQAQTRILFLYGKNRWKGEGKIGQEEFVDYHKVSALIAGAEQTYVEGDGNLVFALKAAQLENFLDESSIKEQVDEFKSFLKTNKLPWVFDKF